MGAGWARVGGGYEGNLRHCPRAGQRPGTGGLSSSSPCPSRGIVATIRQEMGVYLEITDRGGLREHREECEQFWIGSLKSSCKVTLDLPDWHGRVLEVKLEPSGRLRIRTEPGLPFPVRSATGNVGSRFETLLDGDVLNLGPALLRLRYLPSVDEAVAAQELDPSTLTTGPGAPVGGWYQTFMEVADHLEGLTEPGRMVRAAMDAMIQTTGADRVYLQLDPDHGIGGKTVFYLARDGERSPFRVSRSLVEQVRTSGRVVHVPVASADPVASQFQSVRVEGISASIALPITALGKTLGVIYADCVRDGAVLSAEDLHRVVFVSRLLASALGNRVLVASLVKAGSVADGSVHWALQTNSPACTDMVEHVKLYAPADYTVLIRGETGTGKEVIARALHDLSRRRKGPFVPVNCAAIPEPLMESMLFGHEKGAFTGATQARRGHFEEAHGGTVFLDEIGDMAMDLQAKILRVLQDRMVSPVGSRRMIKVDVRILAATHQDLEQMCDKSLFREDLYFRLRELEVCLPPLRHRTEDILLLSNRFLKEAAEELEYREVPELAADALDHLLQWPWRGNIRELRFVIKGAALHAAGGPIMVEHLERGSPAGGNEALGRVGEDASGTWKQRLEAQECLALKQTMEAAAGNLTRGAELFGVPRTTYREKLVRHGLLQ